ncbi:MAG: 2-amino-4-hydroxy-6-hydroxymethyldihydropteridine diphosphokinase [Anaerolineae bacterium]|jgi:2-amino-4-hydroxy-6-hydroxymethyldihydropteridine diphosphokinase|nr:2-amino-4-hydroxy-6-hydroxymethyldihydropteridine diphosphokinase [Anaerolineae bacterium]
MMAAPRPRVYVALGGNIDPQRWLQYGLDRLREAGEVLAVSSVYETPPFGYLDQPNFLDVTIGMHTDLSPTAFKQLLYQIEGETGRVRANQKTKWGPLELDLDILLWGETAFTFGDKPWRVPNEGIAQYAAVAVPLAEIAPEAVYPLTGERIADIAARLGRDGFSLRPDVVVR